MPAFHKGRHTNNIPVNFFDRFVCFRKITTKGARFQTRPHQTSAAHGYVTNDSFAHFFFRAKFALGKLFSPSLHRRLFPLDIFIWSGLQMMKSKAAFDIDCSLSLIFVLFALTFFAHTCVLAWTILEIWNFVCGWCCGKQTSTQFLIFCHHRVEGLLVCVIWKEERFYARFCWQWLIIVEKLVLQFVGCIWWFVRVLSMIG